MNYKTQGLNAVKKSLQISLSWVGSVPLFTLIEDSSNITLLVLSRGLLPVGLSVQILNATLHVKLIGMRLLIYLFIYGNMGMKLPLLLRGVWSISDMNELLYSAMGMLVNLRYYVSIP